MGSLLQMCVKRLLAGTWKEISWRLAKVYGVAALIHSFIKVLLVTLRTRKRLRMIRGCKGGPYDAAGKELVKNFHRIHDWRRDELLKYPGEALVRATAPGVELVANTPEAVEFILKGAFNKVSKPTREDDYTFGILGEFLGDEGIFVLPHGQSLPQETSLWSAQRKTASQIFTKNNFQQLMYDTLTKTSDSVVAHVARAAERNKGLESAAKVDGANVVDLESTFFSFTFDSIQKIFFNRNVDTVSSGKQDPYAQAFDDAHREMMLHMFASLPVHILTTVVLPFPFGALRPKAGSLNPGFQFYRHFVEPHYGRFRQHIATLDRFTYDLVGEARQSWEQEMRRFPGQLQRRGSADLKPEDRRDLLAFFLRGSELTDKQLRDVILNFIIAGRDTTACTLTWMFFELTQNPEVQQRAAEEVYAAFGAEGMPTISDLTEDKLPYLHAVMLETLRLHPPVPEDVKIAQEDLHYLDGTVIPQHCRLVYSPYSMGRDPTRYPDPLVFRPERWLGAEDPTANPTSNKMFELPVFQAGPRYCLGMNLAKNETKLLASRLLQRFSFRLEASEKPQDHTYALMITMSLTCDKERTRHELNVVPSLRTWA